MKKVLIISGIAFVLFAVSVAVSFNSIYQGVREIAETARQEYKGDTVESLMALLRSESHSFKDKNRAIWALGQIGDKRALPELKRLDTDEIQPKPWDPNRIIVQYSVEKAIRQIKDGFIATRWMYRDL